MKAITNEEFKTRILPLYTTLDPKDIVFKRVKLYKHGKLDAIGIYKSEMNKHIFFCVLDKRPKEAHPVYSALYYLKPITNLSEYPLSSKHKDKIDITADNWAISIDTEELSRYLVEVPVPEQLKVGFDLENIGQPFKEEETARRVEEVKQQELELEVSSEEYNHTNPSHYAGNGGIEAIEVIECFFEDSYNLGNVFKYIARAGKKPETPTSKDLKKATWYLINELKKHMDQEELKNFLENEIINKHT